MLETSAGGQVGVSSAGNVFSSVGIKASVTVESGGTLTLNGDTLSASGSVEIASGGTGIVSGGTLSPAATALIETGGTGIVSGIISNGRHNVVAGYNAGRSS